MLTLLRDLQEAYLHSTGCDSLAGKSTPVAPMVARLNPRPPTSRQNSDTPRRPGVGLTLSIASDVSLDSTYSPDPCSSPSSAASSTFSHRSQATSLPPPPRSAPPNCPLPPPPTDCLPFLPGTAEYNPLHRCGTASYQDGSLRSPTLSPLHHRLISKSKDLINISVSSIWTSTPDLNFSGDHKTSSIASSEIDQLDHLDYASVDEDLLESSKRPSLSTSTSSSSDSSADQIKFLSVFDREPSLTVPIPAPSPAVSPRSSAQSVFDPPESDSVPVMSGGFNWTPTEKLTLTLKDKERLNEIMGVKVSEIEFGGRKCR